MIKCWQEDPIKRPDFREVVDEATTLLEKMGGAPPAPAGSRSLVSDMCAFVSSSSSSCSAKRDARRTRIGGGVVGLSRD